MSTWHTRISLRARFQNAITIFLQPRSSFPYVVLKIAHHNAHILFTDENNHPLPKLKGIHLDYKGMPCLRFEAYPIFTWGGGG